MNIKDFKKALHNGVVEFSYFKKDGSIRDAKGTLSKEVYGEEHEPKGTGYSTPDNVVKYYDLNSEGWRSFLFENFAGLKTDNVELENLA